MIQRCVLCPSHLPLAIDFSSLPGGCRAAWCCDDRAGTDRGSRDHDGIGTPTSVVALGFLLNQSGWIRSFQNESGFVIRHSLPNANKARHRRQSGRRELPALLSLTVCWSGDAEQGQPGASWAPKHVKEKRRRGREPASDLPDTPSRLHSWLHSYRRERHVTQGTLYSS